MSAVASEIYNQFDFVPDSQLHVFAEAGYSVGSTPEWLLIPTDIGNAMLTEIDVNANAHVSELSYITPAEWETMLANPSIQGVPLSIGMRGRLRQVLLSARICTGVIRAPAPPVDPKSEPTTIIHNHGVGEKEGMDTLTTVNVMDVYLQGAEPCRIKIMPETEFDAGLALYKKVEGIDCPLDKRPTIEQASAFLEVLRKKGSIYGDDAILVPHGDRALMRRHFTARVMTSTGEFQTMEVYGPPTYKDWIECRNILTSLTIMFNVVSGGPVRGYAELIGELDARYPEAWGLIYQTDVRTRNEHARRVKTKLATRHAKAIAKTPPEESDFDPARPWAQVFVELITGESEWWMNNIRLPGIEIVAKVTNPERFIDGDALTRKRERPPTREQDRSPLKRRRGAEGGGGGTSSSWSHPRMNNHFESRAPGGNNHPNYDERRGCFTTNKAGYKICEDHNEGECGRADQYNQCPRDNRSVHQCSVCLQSGHAAHESRKCPKQEGGAPGGRGGGGLGDRGRGNGGRGRVNGRRADFRGDRRGGRSGGRGGNRS